MWKRIKEYFMPIYVSELDQFLEDFDKKQPEFAPSQRQERDKYQRIYQLRDSKTD